ncbi:MAG: cytochrome c [Acidobacteriota bacterium]|nr:cytochrome c [Acidobacteriota bacterium]
MKKLVLLISLCLVGLAFYSSSSASGNTKDKTPVTFAKHIAPIFQNRCETCHREGGVAPMPLATYEEARPWARAIKEKVVSRQMPPFHATGAIGRYDHDPRLNEEEIATIAKWVDGGVAKGNPKDMPAPKSWNAGWDSGQPDLVLTVRKAYTLKKSATDQYVFFVFDHVFTEDTLIRGIVTKPGNAKAVHHANTHLVPPNMKTAEDGYFEGDFDPGARGTIMISGWVPGSNDVMLPAGTAVRIPKGMRFGIQIHYGPNEKELVDQTSLGIYMADGTVKKNLRMLIGDRKDLQIQPGDANYSLISKKTFDTDAVIRFFHVHMHLRGKSYAFRFTYPDGRVETLFDVPKYDFNWQRSYVLAQPISVPKGTAVEFIGTYDNSAKNKFNPDPTKTIRWGEKTTDEMMQGRIFYESATEDLNLKVKKGRVVTSAETASKTQ